jgi:hypothetical protein
MILYRRLTGQELKELELEFKQFLIANGIYDLDWKKLNEESPEKAQDLVDLFSNVVLEKALKKIEYIARKTANNLDVFCFQEENAFLVSLSSSGENINFLKDNWMELLPKNFEEVKYFKLDKRINNRPKEIFQLLSSGCEIVDAKLYHLLDELSKKS